MMKPKAQGPHDEGFLEYLEDIIGTNKYVEKIDESFTEWVLCSFVNSIGVYILLSLSASIFCIELP